MNKQRRKELNEISARILNTFKTIDNKKRISIIESLRDIVNDLEDIKRDEENYMYNIPDNMQNGSRYADAEEACDNMDMAISYLSDVVDNEECTVQEINDTLVLCMKYVNLAAV